MKVEFYAFEQLWAFLNQKHNVEFVFAWKLCLEFISRFIGGNRDRNYFSAQPSICLSIFLSYSKSFLSIHLSICISLLFQPYFFQSIHPSTIFLSLCLNVVQSLSLYFPFLISHFNLFLSLLSSIYQKQSLSTFLSICLSLKNLRSPSLRRFNQAWKLFFIYFSAKFVTKKWKLISI